MALHHMAICARRWLIAEITPASAIAKCEHSNAGKKAKHRSENNRKPEYQSPPRGAQLSLPNCGVSSHVHSIGTRRRFTRASYSDKTWAQYHYWLRHLTKVFQGAFPCGRRPGAAGCELSTACSFSRAATACGSLVSRPTGCSLNGASVRSNISPSLVSLNRLSAT